MKQLYFGLIGCIFFAFCSVGGKTYTKYWFGLKPFKNVCRDSVYLSYGIRFEYVGVADNAMERHNEEIDEKLKQRNGYGWEEKLKSDLSTCPGTLDSLMGW